MIAEQKVTIATYNGETNNINYVFTAGGWLRRIAGLRAGNATICMLLKCKLNDRWLTSCLYTVNKLPIIRVVQPSSILDDYMIYAIDAYFYIMKELFPIKLFVVPYDNLAGKIVTQQILLL